MFLQGNQFFKAGSYVNALDAYNRAVALEPTEPTYALNRAMCHLKLYQYVVAKLVFTIMFRKLKQDTDSLVPNPTVLSCLKCNRKTQKLCFVARKHAEH